MRLISPDASPRGWPLTGALALALLALGGCSQMPKLSELTSATGDKVLGLVRPYRVEVVQGNVLTKELLASVKPGMPRAQVQDLLGSPMLTDVFHEERWDYIFTIRRQGTEPQRRHVVVWFEGDALKSVDAPSDIPTEREFVASINSFKPKGDSPKLALSEAERKALPTPAKQAPAAVEPMGPIRSYPPLEPRS